MPAKDLERVVSSIMDAVAVLEPGVEVSMSACPHGITVAIDEGATVGSCQSCGMAVFVHVYLRGWPLDIRTMGR